MATKTAARAANETGAQPSSAELAADREKQIGIRAAAEVEHQELVAGLRAASLAGEEALGAHEQKTEAARRRAVVAGARAEELTRQYDDAVLREHHDDIRARCRKAEQASARIRTEIEDAYGQLREVFALLVREKALDDEIRAINLLIQNEQSLDLEILPDVEAWRFEPATPAVEEEVEVEREVQRTREIQGGAPGSVITKIQTLPETERRMVKERRVVKPAIAEFRPAPLYDMFAVPRLRRDDSHLIVPGSEARLWWDFWKG